MSHNNFFSPSRFLHLLRHDWLIHKKMYLLVLAGLAIGVYGVTYSLIIMDEWNFFTASGYAISALLLVVAVLVFIGNAFPDLRNQIQTSNYLLLPGSVFEKFMVQFVLRILLFVPLALGVLSIGNHLAKASILADTGKEIHLNFDHFREKSIKIENHVIGINEPIKINFNPSRIPDFNLGEAFNRMNFFNSTYYNLGSDLWNVLVFILYLFSFATILFAGSVYFKGLPLIKSLVSLAILAGVFVLTLLLSQYFLFPEDIDKVNMNDVLSPNIGLFISILSIITCPVFLVFTYFRLKEKEV